VFRGQKRLGTTGIDNHSRSRQRCHCWKPQDKPLLFVWCGRFGVACILWTGSSTCKLSVIIIGLCSYPHLRLWILVLNDWKNTI